MKRDDLGLAGKYVSIKNSFTKEWKTALVLATWIDAQTPCLLCLQDDGHMFGWFIDSTADCKLIEPQIERF